MYGESVLFVLVIFYEFIIGAYTEAVTPQSCAAGIPCIPIEDCTEYMVFIKYLQKPLDPDVAHFLKSKQCGFEETSPKVCCPDLAEAIRANSTPKAATSQGCVLGNECVPLENCTDYMVFIKFLNKPLKRDVVKFLRSRECGFRKGSPKVCCPNFGIGQNYATLTPSIGKQYKVCEEQNKCTPLQECKQIMEVINNVEKPLPSLLVKFLRAQQCGFHEGFPMVCNSTVPEDIIKLLKQSSSNVSNTDTKTFIQAINSTDITLAEAQTSTEAVVSSTQHVQVQTATSRPRNYYANRRMKQRAEAINRMFDDLDLFDFAGQFDLFRRKRFTDGSALDVEIR